MLPVIIREVRSRGLPKRKIEIVCDIANDAKHAIYILDAWVTVQALQSIVVAEGRLFHLLFNRVDPATIPSKNKVLGVFEIDLSGRVIQSIEERRGKEDIPFSITSRVLVCSILDTVSLKTLGLPYETEFGDGRSGGVSHVVPRSDWIKHLRTLQWSEIEILELPSGQIQATEGLGRAAQRLEDATTCYRLGQWEETLLNCRKVFEAMVQDVTGKQKMEGAPDALSALIGSGGKIDALDSLVKALGEFCHLGRHETPADVRITQGDALLILRATGALLGYLAKRGK